MQISLYSLIALKSSAAGHDNGDNETEEANSFSEDENKDHSYEELGLNCVHSNTNISDHTNGETRSLRL